MKRLYWISIVLFAFASCVGPDAEVNIVGAGDSGVATDTSITPSCVIESRAVSRNSAGVAMRSLIDQVTTKRR